MPVLLPSRFRFAHDVAIDLHDILVHIIVEGDEHGLFTTPVDLKNSSDRASFARIQNGEVYDWLEQNGYQDELHAIALRHVAQALIADFCNFVLEALRASEKGKMTVAWTLFRKAFKDNLFYLEWMLASPAEFVDKFHNEGPQSIDVSNRNAVPEHKMVEVISGAINASSHPGWASAEFIHALRYDKSHAEGLESMWNKASHLITRVPHYRTEARNFNFIFSGPGEMMSQWQHLYYYIPFLMYHAVLVIEKLCFGFTGADPLVNLVSDYRRDAGFYLWTRDVGFPHRDGVCVHPWEIIRDLPGIFCIKCEQVFLPHVRQMQRLYTNQQVRCRVCKTDIDLLSLHYAIAGVPDPRDTGMGEDEDDSATE